MANGLRHLNLERGAILAKVRVPILTFIIVKVQDTDSDQYLQLLLDLTHKDRDEFRLAIVITIIALKDTNNGAFALVLNY